MSDVDVLCLPSGLEALLALRGYGAPIGTCELFGGTINRVRRVDTASGKSFVVKENVAGANDMFPLEAVGLQALGHAGAPVAEVIADSGDYLLLEYLEDDGLREPDWEAFGRAVGRLHGNRSARFGWTEDNYCGVLKVSNSWRGDGHDFFAETRMLDFLRLPKCEEAFDAVDRRGIEIFAHRLRDLIPVQPASLLHGDLWSANILPTKGGVLKMIDPAPFYAWAEIDLVPMLLYPGIPDAFFGAYEEINRLEPGYRDRFLLLAVREWLAIIAQFGGHPAYVGKVRQVIAPYIG